MDDVDCHVIESVPGDDTVKVNSGYSKKITWVRSDNFVETKVEYYDLAGRLLKTQRVTKPQVVDAKAGRWFPLSREMTNHQTGHKTTLNVLKLETNVPTPDELFTTRYIERDCMSQCERANRTRTGQQANRRTGQQANRVAGLTIVLLTLASSASAQSDVSGPSLLEQAGATVTFRAGLWSSTRELDPEGPFGAGMLWGKIARPITPQISVVGDGWMSLRGPLDRGHARGELREAFVTFTSGPIELRAGRQIIAWGRADGINPTDNLTAQDLTLLAPDDSDRRLGATALRFTYSHRDISATAIWLPEFRSHRIPVPAALGDLPASTSEWRADQFAVRIEQTGRAVDWSVSGFRGGDLSPDLGIGQQANGRTGERVNGLSLSHHDVFVIGADAAGNVGRYGLRAEAAYQFTEDRSGVDPFVKNPFLSVVAGGDRTFREHLNVNVQYLYRFVAHFTPPGSSGSPFENLVALEHAAMSGQTRRHQHGASARISYKWLHDTLEAEVAAAGYASPRGGTLRPKVTYAVSDRMKVLVGGELYRGDAMSVFGILRDNSGAFAEVRWSF